MRKYKSIGLCMAMGLTLLGGCGKISSDTTKTTDSAQLISTEQNTETDTASVEEYTQEHNTEDTEGTEQEVADTEDNKETSDISEAATTENTNEDYTVLPDTEEDKAVADVDNAYDAYKLALNTIITDRKMPDGLELAEPFGDVSANKFAIADVDMDGKEELVVSWNDTISVGMMEFVYDYNAETQGLYLELTDYPSIKYYDNGIATAIWSHNQGLGGEKIWPYNWYKYDAAADVYNYVGYVDSWDKDTFPTNNDGEPFPENIDKDGAGTVYDIDDKGEYTQGFAYSQSDYDAFVAGLIGGANELTLDWKDITEENINSIN